MWRGRVLHCCSDCEPHSDPDGWATWRRQDDSFFHGIVKFICAAHRNELLVQLKDGAVHTGTTSSLKENDATFKVHKREEVGMAQLCIDLVELQGIYFLVLHHQVPLLDCGAPTEWCTW